MTERGKEGRDKWHVGKGSEMRDKQQMGVDLAERGEQPGGMSSGPGCAAVVGRGGGGTSPTVPPYLSCIAATPSSRY